MTRTRDAFVLVIVLVAGFALATSTRPVTVESVVSNASPIAQSPGCVLFAATCQAAHRAATRARSNTVHAVVAVASGPTEPREPASPSEFFDRK